MRAEQPLIDPGHPMRRAAFFDLDNTLIRGSALFHLASGMVAHGLVSRREITAHAWTHIAYRVRGECAQDIAILRDRALALTAGVSVERMLALSEQVYDERVAPRMYEQTLALAAAHSRAGDAVWLVTAAPRELAELVAQRCGFTGALGTVGEIRDGVWTGRLVGELLHREAKAAAVRALAEREQFDLEECSAYSDSLNDLPLLESVGRPQVVNPDRNLQRVAHRRGWPVHEFRLTPSLFRSRSLRYLKVS